MNIGFRADASIQIGTGHIMRCLTLADSMRNSGAQCTFICRSHLGHLMDVIVRRGHQVIALPIVSTDPAPLPCMSGPTHYQWLGTTWHDDAEYTRYALGSSKLDWLVVDHYAIDESWESDVRKYCRNLMVIDDLADRPHNCDLLLDQNLNRSQEDYKSLCPKHCQLLIGTRYALLRPEFLALRPTSLDRRKFPQLRHLLLFMGGIDEHNITGQILNRLMSVALPEKLKITVIMGEDAPWKHQVRSQARRMRCIARVLTSVEDMAFFMEKCDLAIGAAGSTSWERCCLGLPSLLLVLSSNQKKNALALQELGAAQVIQNIDEIASKVVEFFEGDGPTKLKEMSIAAAEVADGCGTEKVVQIMGMLGA